MALISHWGSGSTDKVQGEADSPEGAQGADSKEATGSKQDAGGGVRVSSGNTLSLWKLLARPDAPPPPPRHTSSQSHLQYRLYRHHCLRRPSLQVSRNEWRTLMTESGS